ncbi:MAG: DUF202 domain-containing protein [Caulobacteraceae bacterium]|nr:DUF202 domain-containing protein [Caulobacteraceae bacterium]
MGDVGKHVEQQAEAVRDSAKTIEPFADAQVDSADRRTELAADRTVLAAERTYAAWVRTGLAALASGVGAHLARPYPSGLVRHGHRLDADRPDARRLPSNVLVGLNGFLIMVDLFALVGIWLAKM